MMDGYVSAIDGWVMGTHNWSARSYGWVCSTVYPCYRQTLCCRWMDLRLSGLLSSIAIIDCYHRWTIDACAHGSGTATIDGCVWHSRCAAVQYCYRFSIDGHQMILQVAALQHRRHQLASLKVRRTRNIECVGAMHYNALCRRYSILS